MDPKCPLLREWTVEQLVAHACTLHFFAWQSAVHGTHGGYSSCLAYISVTFTGFEETALFDRHQCGTHKSFLHFQQQLLTGLYTLMISAVILSQAKQVLSSIETVRYVSTSK